MGACLEIIAPAEDTLLASIEAMRVAAGLAADDDSRDDELEAIGERVSAEIVEACAIAVGSGAEPTLRQERVAETFTLCGDEVLILSRRHNASIVSVTENGTAVTLDDRSLDGEAGLLERWVDGRRSCWSAREVVVTYDAGFEDVPRSLEGAVVDLVRIRLSAAAVDPLVKGVTVDVEGIESVRTDRWVGALPGTGNVGIPADIMARLERFVNRQMR